MWAAARDSEAIHASHARVTELVAERASFNAGTEQTMAEFYTSATRICEPDISVATCKGELALWSASRGR